MKQISFNEKVNMMNSSEGLKTVNGSTLHVDYMCVQGGVSYLHDLESGNFYASNSKNVVATVSMILDEETRNPRDQYTVVVHSGKGSNGREFLYITLE